MTPTTKTCFRCAASKPLAEFYAHPAMADGHLGKCKNCTKQDARQHRDKNLESIREYDRRRSALPARLAHLAANTRRWRAANPDKAAAHAAVGNAVRDGRLIKRACEVCNSVSVHAHHDDYAKPLEVRWLCAMHHSHEHHQKEKRA